MYRFASSAAGVAGVIGLGAAACELLGVAAALVARNRTLRPAVFLWALAAAIAQIVLVVLGFCAVLAGPHDAPLPPAAAAVSQAAGLAASAAIVALLLLKIKAVFPVSTLQFQSWAGVGASLILFNIVLLASSLGGPPDSPSPPPDGPHIPPTPPPPSQPPPATPLPPVADPSNTGVRESIYTLLESLFSLAALCTLVWASTCHKPSNRSTSASALLDIDGMSKMPASASVPPPPSPLRRAGITPLVAVRFVYVVVLHVALVAVSAAFLVGAGSDLWPTTDVMHGLLYAGELSLLLALRLQPSSARPRRNFSCDPMNSFAAADNANNDDDDDDDDDIDDDIDDDKEYDVVAPTAFAAFTKRGSAMTAASASIGSLGSLPRVGHGSSIIASTSTNPDPTQTPPVVGSSETVQIT